MKKAIVFICLMLLPVCALASDVTFSWDEYTAPADGIEIFIVPQSEEYNTDTPIWTGSVVPPATVNGLASDIPYKAVVRAYKDPVDGPPPVPKLVSEYSNEVEFTINSADMIVPPTTIRIKTILIRF